MTSDEWESGFGRSIGMFLNGNGIHGRDSRGGRITADGVTIQEDGRFI